MCYDTHIYYVTTINGYRTTWMTEERAKEHANKLKGWMELAGWRGTVRIHYRDGSVTEQLQVGSEGTNNG